MLAVDDDTGATLHTFTAAGRAFTTIAVPGHASATPRGSGRVLAWPLADRTSGGGRLVWVDVILGREIFALEIESAPLTQPAAFGNDLVSGGGSHWLVGTTAGLVAVRDTLVGRRLQDGAVNIGATPVPRIVGSWTSTDGEVRQVLVVGDLVVVGLAAPDAEGVQRYRALRRVLMPPDNWVFETVGADMLAPGNATAHPVAWNCNDNGERRGWHCPADAEGTLVVGGDGWLVAWRLPEGVQTLSETSDLRWTGLSLGRGGWVAGGGSHWLPAEESVGWRVVSYVPGLGEPIELLAGIGGDCVASPLWDTDGSLVGAAPGASPFVVQGAGGKNAIGMLTSAEGWSRPHGNASNGGSEVLDVGTCADGIVRAHEHFPLAAEEISGVAHGAFRDVVHGARNGFGYLRFLPGFGADTAIDVTDASFIDQLVVVDLNSVVFARTSNDGSGIQSLRRHDELNRIAFDHVLPGEEGGITGLVEPAAGTWFVGARRGDRDVIHRVTENDGWQEAREFGVDTPDIGLVRLLPGAARDGASRGGEGAVMVLVADNRLILRRVDAQLDEVATATWSEATTLAFIDAAVDWHGRVRVIVADPGAPSAGPLLLQYSQDLRLESTTVLPAAGPIAFDGLGASLVATTAGTFRIGVDGTVNALYPVGSDLFPINRGVNYNGSGYSVLLQRFSTEGRTLVRVNTDLIGLGSCGAAGSCLNVNADACDGVTEACVASGCEPVSGQCATTTFPGCTE